MTKIRRGGYVFITWVGDHQPRHAHVHGSGRLITKWDVENDKPIGPPVTGRLRAIIAELMREGRL